jgi:DNA-binding HxlR family transcriptional regulator
MKPSARKTSAAEAACPRCPAAATIEVLGGRWKAHIVWHLLQGTRRFGELHRALGGVTQKVLTQQLRELEADGVVSRKVFAEVPPRVEYSLTERGWSIKPVIDAMCKWGKGRTERRRMKAEG